MTLEADPTAPLDQPAKWLLTVCWCEHHTRYIRRHTVIKGSTWSCHRQSCHPPTTEEPTP